MRAMVGPSAVTMATTVLVLPSAVNIFVSVIATFSGLITMNGRLCITLMVNLTVSSLTDESLTKGCGKADYEHIGRH